MVLINENNIFLISSTLFKSVLESFVETIKYKFMRLLPHFVIFIIDHNFKLIALSFKL